MAEAIGIFIFVFVFWGVLLVLESSAEDPKDREDREEEP
jgi:hypothetical protein